MLVDDIGDVTITNDGATILKQLEVEHPAAKVSPWRYQDRSAVRGSEASVKFTIDVTFSHSVLRDSHKKLWRGFVPQIC